MTTEPRQTPDEAFGEAVAIVRAARELSQREFAAALGERGLRVDAPAVSRIEKGVRAVRLAEALIIADVLGVDLAFLTNGADQTPARQLRRARKMASDAHSAVRRPLIDFVQNYLWVVEVLEENPDLVGTIEPGGEGIGSPIEYFGWAANRIEDLERARRANGEVDLDDDIVVVPTETHRQGIGRLVDALLESVIMSQDEFDAALDAEESRRASAVDSAQREAAERAIALERALRNGAALEMAGELSDDGASADSAE